MHVRRRPTLFAALLLAASLLAPAPAGAHSPADQRPAALRGGLSAIAHGAPIGDLIDRQTTSHGDEIAVSLQLDSAPDLAVRRSLRAAGLAIRGSWGATLDGFVAPSRLAELATVPTVRSMVPIRHARASGFVGPTPAIHGAAAWQQAGYLGTGVKVGILDGGFDGFAGLLGSELPATVQARCYPRLGAASTALSDCVTPGESHGTAVAESIVDMAPGASLYVSNAWGPADMLATVAWMTAAGVRVINFSQSSGILLEGMGDGTSTYSNSIYGLVDQAVAGGALFVASAGNSGETSWQGTPTDDDANGWVEFAPADEANYLDLGADQEIAVALRWASATSDYGLSIWQGDTMLAQSEDSQSATGDPFEFLDFTAPSAGRYELSVRHGGGPVAPTMRMLVWSGQATQLSYRTTVGSLAAPADSRNPGLVTVGAVDYRSPTIAEPYSSRGPTLDGRTKPDIVASDCAPTLTYPVFCGTSEAAPVVSGAAALILEAEPTLTPVQLAAYLRARATPLGSPIPNNDTGSGLLALGAPANVPASIAFLAPAASGTEGLPLLGQPAVGILDSAGALVTKGPGASLQVALSIGANAGGGTLACPAGLTGTAVAGVVLFTGCSIDKAAIGYTLKAEAPGLPPVLGAPFAVAATGTPPALGLTASATAVRYGTAIALTGHAALPNGASVAIDAVRLVGGREADVRPAITDATGAASWSFKPIVTSDYRIRTTAAGTGLVEVSAPIHVVVSATAILTSSIPSGRTISRTTSIVITNTIRPIGATVARARARIDIFQRTSSGWVRRRTVYANADTTGRARATIRLSSVGSWWIRSRAEPTSTNAASTWTTGVRYTVR